MDNKNYIIRLAKESDCVNLAKLRKEVWEETYRGIYNDDIIDNYNYADAINMFKNLLSCTNIFLYVVESKKNLVGYMSVGKPYREFRNYNQEIGLLYLKSSFQKRGIGRELFNIAKEKIKESGNKNFFISCNKYNVNARMFYEKMSGKLVFEDKDNFEDKRPVQVKYHFEV